jgi:alanine racemase
VRPTQAIIDLAAIRHNVSQIRASLPKSTRMIAVVKANAYGHGAIPVSRAALGAGADWLAVALPEEGAELRAAGFKVPILVLGLTLPEQAQLFAGSDLTATAASPEGLQALHAAAGNNRRIRVMIKLDTGMGRIGLQPDAAVTFVRQALSLSGLEIIGLYTHFAAADEEDCSFTQAQLERLNQAVQALHAAGIELPVVSAANSAATDSFPMAHLDAVRPGIILYGLPPAAGMPLHLSLKPAMSLVTRIVFIKRVPAGTTVNYGRTYRTPAATWLATLPVGYADGYSRHLSNQAAVLVGGIRRRVVGRICMDQTVIDLGPDCDAAVGDEAVLCGRQGQDEITLTELAGLAGTINYELACGISPRVPRVYIGNE